MEISKKKPHPSMGIIRLDYCYPPALGDIDHIGTFNFDVYYKVVPGLTFELCQKGERLQGKVEERFRQSIMWLIKEKNVKVITGDCGFMMYYQNFARSLAGVSIPVVLSPICQLPSIACAFSYDEEIIIMTANEEHFMNMKKRLRHHYNIDPENRRYNVIGCDKGRVDGFEAVSEGSRVDTAKVEKGVVKLAQESLIKHPKSTAFLFECTELPPYSDAVREATGLPVYDAITCCSAIMEGFLDNSRFGTNHWQEEWDRQQEDYTYGQNLTPEEWDELQYKPEEKPF